MLRGCSAEMEKNKGTRRPLKTLRKRLRHLLLPLLRISLPHTLASIALHPPCKSSNLSHCFRIIPTHSLKLQQYPLPR